MKNKIQALAVSGAALMATAKGVMAQTVEVPTTFFPNVQELISAVLRFVLLLGVLLVLLYLIWGGIEWITSGGDKTKTESARNKITAAVIGLIILVASWAILQLIMTFIGAGDINTLFESIKR
jgi:hypothetical protein